MAPKNTRNISSLATEQRNQRSEMIDLLPVFQILQIINSEDKLVAIAVEREMSYIAEAVELVVENFRKGGRLIYVGAGTSGRLAVVDSSECPPTFGTDPGMVTAIIAGGRESVFQSQEGAEDNTAQAVADINAKKIRAEDVVCGIAASRSTPYVVAAVQRARELGAKTIFVTTNPRTEFDLVVDVAICPGVGPEVIMGSTRMKSGTAQKLVLNMITTAAMIKLGKVYENMMVDLQLTNEKLLERAKQILIMATGIDYEMAQEILPRSGGHVKTAIVMIKAGVSADEARARLKKANGFVRLSLDK